MPKQEIGGSVLTVKVVPASSKTAVCGLHNGMLKIKVSAAPEKGRANRRLIEFLADLLGVKKSSIRIISGQNAAVKQIAVAGITSETLLKKLNLI